MNVLRETIRRKVFGGNLELKTAMDYDKMDRESGNITWLWFEKKKDGTRMLTDD